MSTLAAAPRARVERTPGVGVVAVRVSLPGGARAEAIPGQALLTGRLLAEGTARRDHAALAGWVESRGMLLHAGGSFESHGFALDALAGDWEEALDLAAELVFEPAFAAERVAWVATQTMAELESLGDQPEVRTAWGFLDQLYRPHRRARPLQGTADSLATLAAEDCAAFHRRALAAGMLVAVTGEIDEAAVEARLADLFARLPAAAGPLPEPPDPAGSGEARHVVALPPAEDEETAQAHLYAGHLTVDRRHPDYDALSLAAVVLGAGSGLTGRVPERVREREGLAYTASADVATDAGHDPGRLTLYAGTSVATVEQAERAMREVLAEFVADGPSEEEVADARAYLVGRAPFRRETARQIADLLIAAERYGLPLDRPGWREERLRALGRDDVAAAVRRHLDPGALRVTVGVPAAA